MILLLWNVGVSVLQEISDEVGQLGLRASHVRHACVVSYLWTHLICVQQNLLQTLDAQFFLEDPSIAQHTLRFAVVFIVPPVEKWNVDKHNMNQSFALGMWYHRAGTYDMAVYFELPYWHIGEVNTLNKRPHTENVVSFEQHFLALKCGYPGWTNHCLWLCKGILIWQENQKHRGVNKNLKSEYQNTQRLSRITNYKLINSHQWLQC